MRKDNIVYPELSYKLQGFAFKIAKELGGGYQEKHYQKVYAIELERNEIKFKEQLSVYLKYGEYKLGKYFLDFLVEGKIVVELKVGHRIYPRDIRQVLGYLESAGIKLGIIFLFTREGVKYKRVINSKYDKRFV
jgi:GxxExxY protein